MRLAEVSNRLSEVAQRYEVPKRVGAASQKIHEGMSYAGDAARRGAHVAYRMAREHPGTSVASLVLAAALVGGVLWYLFGDPRHPPFVSNPRSDVSSAGQSGRLDACSSTSRI